MSIVINQEACSGCGLCRQACPGSLLYPNEAGKTVIKYPKDCWGCTSCVKECSAQAIRYYLGADIGGKGSTLYTRQASGLLHWVLVDNEGKETVITVDKTQANAY